ncbi:MAG: hypothetical protein JRI79_05600 [Deltaproteobacteria bacterium]|nr:hypothetical protein [Deltaproteobacteria bacterium]MBW2044539.1 hypothetical protein [Deltaproteobacteria bacterium]MBW2300015.1 hypothetical protein [Deltaproteobacteria bacterium]
MEKESTKQAIRIPQLSSSEFKEKQSVRTTFKLSRKAVDAINILAVHLGVKRKSIFEYLLEDTDCLSLIARDMEDLREKDLDEEEKIQKTYVLSRKTLSCVEDTSRAFHIPRDALVEYSIRRLVPLVEKEREKHRKRKRILQELEDYLAQGQEILKESRELLEKDDPVYYRLEPAINAVASAFSHIHSFVQKGEMIEDFDVDLEK